MPSIRRKDIFPLCTLRLESVVAFQTGFMLYSVWAWHVICSPDAFSWNFGFMFLNLAQVVYLVYEMRPVKFDPELEEVYHTLFEPFKVCTIPTKTTFFYKQNTLRKLMFINE